MQNPNQPHRLRVHTLHLHPDALTYLLEKSDGQMINSVIKPASETQLKDASSLLCLCFSKPTIMPWPYVIVYVT